MERIEPGLVFLKQGTYWRPRADIAYEGITLRGTPDREAYIIKAETMLLLQSIRDVDNKAHTIIMRPHPADYGKEVLIRKPSDHGTEGYSWYIEGLSEFRFLVDDFIAKFEQVEVPEPIRAKSTDQACREAGIVEQTYYRWRKEYSVGTE
jgi:hypothetical protein